MEFRKAVETDKNNIMKIINQAKAYFKENGIDQWQDGYPNMTTIQKDIMDGNGYILLKDKEIVATSAVIFGKEKNYETIFQGKWISEGEYVAIHRIAVTSRYKGLGLSTEIIKNIEAISLEKGVHSIKVDTHKQNLSMQKLLEKNNFQYCGIIYLEDKSERIAFEKIL